ncbi:MAG: DPP IV N-terminal domain-containing protein, partial [Gemmatimonadetes bacterium]|nr:DPP IV N-terminal domain-containing protein [Gemmatimonadota bacterium]
MIRRRAAAATIALLLASTHPGPAQEPAFELTVPNLMRGPEHVGTPPQDLRWTDDGRWLFFRWKPGGQPWHEEPRLYRARASGGRPEALSDQAADSLGVLVALGDISPDRGWRAVAYQGELYLIERSSLAVRRLTLTPAAESSPVFARDGRAIYFIRDDNLFALPLDARPLRQLTDIRTGPEPKEKPAEGQRKAIEEQQKDLFEHIRLEAARKDKQKEREKAREAGLPKPFYIDKEERVSGIAVEPGGRYALLQISKPARDSRRTLVPDYVTASGYTESREVRGKVGDVQAESRIALINLGAREAQWLALGPGPTRADSGAAKAQPPHLAGADFAGWNRDGSLGLIVATSFDYKDRWFQVMEAGSGQVTTVAHDHDDAWLGGLCDRWSRDGGCVGWMPDGRSIYFISERDGYAHVYVVGTGGGDARQLTRGDFEVHSAALSPRKDRFYLQTSEGSPFELHFYHMDLQGRTRTRITTSAGRHDATPSPDGSRLAVVYSRSNRPPEVFLMDNRRGASAREVTASPTAAWRAVSWIEPEIVWFTARDSVRVPARIYRPRDLGAESNGAGIIFVHGAGYLHNVHR